MAPFVVKTIEKKKWLRLTGYVASTAIITISWVNNIVQPAVKYDQLFSWQNLTNFDIVAAILVWPTALYALYVLYLEYKEMKAKKQN